MPGMSLAAETAGPLPSAAGVCPRKTYSATRADPPDAFLRHNGTVPGITELHVNGALKRVNADASRSLLSVLRDDLDLTGTKFGCGEGQCGACTVLIDEQPASRCLTQVGAVGVKRIVTIEGLAAGGNLHPVQEAFLEADAMQCGGARRE